MSGWRVDQALSWAEMQLEGTGEPRTSAILLLAHALGCSPTDLFIHPERVLSSAQEAEFKGLIARRACHEPVAYLTGHRPFFDLDLLVDARVLIPRPETELLVEQALEHARRWPQPQIADVGTGSGAIAVALAVHLTQATIWATDLSADALAVAQINARRYGVAERITFVQGNLLLPLPGPLQLIVANLPYVSEAEWAALPPDVRHEPPMALLAGADGLAAIRALLEQSPRYLTPDGIILAEIGAAQGQSVIALARQTFPQAYVEVIRDYAHLDRILLIDLGRVK